MSELKIVDLEAIPVSVPIKEYYRSAYGVRGESNFVLVKLKCSSGVTGLGEASLEDKWPYGETQASVKYVVEKYIKKRIVGRNAFSVEELSEEIEESIAGNPYAKAAVEMAVNDAVSRYLNIPLNQLLGGEYRGRVEVKFNIPLGSPGTVSRLAERAVREGFRVLKLKVGRDLKLNVSNLEAVRSTVGDKALIGVDANGCWSVWEAVKQIKSMERYDLFFVEQPVPRWNLEGLAEVKSKVSTPIMADESIYTIQDAVKLIKLNAVDMFSIYICKAGGLRNAVKIAAIAEASGIKCTLGSNVELGVGNAFKIHLASALRVIDVPIDAPIWFYEKDVVEPRLVVKDGAVTVPRGAGIGVNLSDELVDEFRVEV